MATRPAAELRSEYCCDGRGSGQGFVGALVEEFRQVRLATISLLKHLPEDAWMRSGVASEKTVTVRALAFIIPGHVAHHLGILRERYL